MRDVLERLETLALDRNCLAKDAANEIREGREFAKLLLEIYDRPDDVLDGYGPGEVDLVLMARKIAKRN